MILRYPKRKHRDQPVDFVELSHPFQLKTILPIGSMYAIYGDIYHQYTPNVSIYSIHGSYGLWRFPKSWGYPLNHPCYVQIFHSKPTILSSMDPPIFNVAQAPTVARALPIRSPTAAPLAGEPSIHVAGAFSRETPGRTASTGQTSPVEWHANGCHPMPNPWPSWPSWLCEGLHIWIHDHPRMKWIWNGMQIEKH